MSIATLVTPYFSIGQDDKGPAILIIQTALRRLGYEVPENGRFEEKTGAAVRQLQREKELEETGLVNVETATAIDAEIHALVASGRITKEA